MRLYYAIPVALEVFTPPPADKLQEWLVPGSTISISSTTWEKVSEKSSLVIAH